MFFKKCIQFILVMLVLIIFVIGCQTPRYNFRYATTYLENPNPEKNTEVLSVPPLKFEVTFEGTAETSDSHLEFTLSLKNSGTEKASLDVQAFDLIDDDGRHFPGIPKGDYGNIKTLDIYPGISTDIPLVFRLSNGYEFQNIGSFKIAWIYTCADATYKHLSKFTKYEVEYREVYVRDPFPWSWGVYWNFHYNFHHHRHH